MPCCTGVQQGEPLSPLLLCAGLSAVTRALEKVFPSMPQSWFMDDGLTLSSESELLALIPVLEDELNKINFELNLSKCELYGDLP